MDDIVGASLDLAFHDQQPRAHDLAPERLDEPGPDDDIGHAGLVAQGDEHDARIARHLAGEHDAGAGDAVAVLANGTQAIAVSGNLETAHHVFVTEQIAQERHQMRAQRQAQHLIVGQHVFAERHKRQGRDLFFRLLFDELRREQRQRVVVGEAAHVPQRLAAVLVLRLEAIGFGEDDQRALGQPRATRHVADAAIGIAAPLDQLERPFLAEAVDLAQAEPQRQPALAVGLQEIVPGAEVHVDMAHFDAMLARVAHDLGRRIEAHRLRVEQRAGERGGMELLDIGRDIDEQREARRMAFGKAVGAEALDLLEAALGEIPGVAALDHAADEHLLERVDGAEIAERRHGAAQAVGLGRRELRRDHGELHRLLLE